MLTVHTIFAYLLKVLYNTGSLRYCVVASLKVEQAASLSQLGKLLELRFGTKLYRLYICVPHNTSESHKTKPSVPVHGSKRGE
jgi:hypothetical protein